MGNLGRTHDAIRAHRRALELDPNNAQARAGLGIAMIFAREGAEALPHIDRACRLSPRDPLLYNWLAYRSLLLLLLARYEDAAADARRSIERAPTHTAWMVRAIALAELGRLEEGRAAYCELERIAPEVTLSSLEHFVRGTADSEQVVERTLDVMRAVGFHD